MYNKIAFVGAGSMAEAIISGITFKNFLRPDQVAVTNKSDHERLSYLQAHYHVQTSPDKHKILDNADVVVLSMKPKDLVDALETIKPFLTERQIIVSVIAGVSTSFISEELAMEIPVIRAMPNTSATIGESATSIAKGKYVTEVQVNQIDELLKAIGTTTIVNEDEMDAITAIAGSGPAYLYYTIESMQHAAVKAGLSSNIADELILQTLVGVTEMLKSTTDTPSTLREKITSPGGTTEAGVEVLKNQNYQQILIECVQRAAERSKELRGTFESKANK